jgi:hypothetical protein
MGPKKSDIDIPYPEASTDARKNIMGKYIENISNIAIHTDKTNEEMIFMMIQSTNVNIVCGFNKEYGYLVNFKKLYLVFNHLNCLIEFYNGGLNNLSKFKVVDIKTENDIYNVIIAINNSIENTGELF